MSNISFKLFGTDDPNAAYLTWVPVPLTISNNSNSTSIRLTSKAKPGAITKLAFMEKREDTPQEEITIQVEKGKEKEVYVAGWFQAGKPHNGASADSKDVSIQAYTNNDTAVAGSLDVMIRVRRNANELSDKARKDFVEALATLNGIGKEGPGKGIYITDFTESHVGGAFLNAHGGAHFLPWHRLFILDLERQLQNINPAVTLPYWKFDAPAPKIFQENFMGATKYKRIGITKSNAVFAANNPLYKWETSNSRKIPRTARFNPETQPAKGTILSTLISENKTLALGGTKNPEFGAERTEFSSMEGTPHSDAHMSFNGDINNITISPQDPLFFLLHCNVDRLWGKWQFLFDRHDSTDVRSYPYQTSEDTSDDWKVVTAKQWPWSGGKSAGGAGDPIPPPGNRAGEFTTSPTGYNFPDNIPTIKDTINYYAYSLANDSGNYLGFACDDVPFDHGNNAMGVTDYKNKIIENIQSESQNSFAMTNEEDSENKLIKVLTDEAASAADKQTALNQLSALAIFSPTLPQKMPEYINALRGLLDNDNEGLRYSAFSKLAVMKDEVAQKILKDELTSDKKEEDKTVPTHLAIAMLGHDEKALDYGFLRKIALKSPNNETLIEVVRHLPDSQENLAVFQQILNDHNAPVEARKMIPSILNRLAPKQFLDSVKNVIKANQQEELFPFLAQAVVETSTEQKSSGSIPKNSGTGKFSATSSESLEEQKEATKKLFEGLQVSPKVKAELKQILKGGEADE